MGEMAAPLLVLSQNVALLLSLVFLHGLIMPALKRLRPRSGSLLSGALYGLISILGMLTPFRVAPGIIVDGRVVVVALAGVFDGPASGLVAAALVMAFRSWLGGVGTISGEGAILTAFLLGALAHWRWSWAPSTTSPSRWTSSIWNGACGTRSRRCSSNSPLGPVPGTPSPP